MTKESFDASMQYEMADILEQVGTKEQKSKIIHNISRREQDKSFANPYHTLHIIGKYNTG